MVPISRNAQKVMEHLIAGLADPHKGGKSARKLDRAPKSFTPLCVERIAPNRYSLAHYAVINGDACPDPEVEFEHALDGRFYPYAITQLLGGRREYGRGVNPTGQRDLRRFAELFLDNIRRQQQVTGPCTDGEEYVEGECA